MIDRQTERAMWERDQLRETDTDRKRERQRAGTKYIQMARQKWWDNGTTKMTEKKGR